MRRQRVAFVLVGSTVLASSIGFAVTTNVSSVLAGIGAVFGGGVLVASLQPPVFFPVMVGVSLAASAGGGYLFFSSGYLVGAVISVLGVVLAGRVFQLHQNAETTE